MGSPGSCVHADQYYLVCREFLSKIVPRILGASVETHGEALDSLQFEDIHALMQDRTSSHLIEVGPSTRSLCTPLSHFPSMSFGNGGKTSAHLWLDTLFAADRSKKVCQQESDEPESCRQRLLHHKSFSLRIQDTTLNVQVIVSVAPSPMLEQLEQKFFRNHLAFLAMHPVANFVVQSLLGSISKSPQVSLPKAKISSNLWTQREARQSFVVKPVSNSESRQ